MLMKFYSPLTAEFFPNEPDWENESYNEYEGCPLDGHDLLQYADAVDEAVKKDIADFNGDLMQYYHEDDFVRSKVVSAVPSVEICGNKLCGCLTVELKETLFDDEQTVLCNYISGQYSDGWGEGFEQRDIRVDAGGGGVPRLARHLPPRYRQGIAGGKGRGRGEEHRDRHTGGNRACGT